jgi:hypothetical protein
VIKYNREFGPELLAVLPFAYWHYKNGTLKKTISSKHTNAFYFFSENHEESFEQRIFDDPVINIPNAADHLFKYDYNKWLQVPLKEHYCNEEFVFTKPLLVISNKYNKEWNNPPINFIDIPTLERLIELLSPKYQIVYNRPKSSNIIMDNSEIYELQDHIIIKQKYSDVLLMQELHDKHNKYSYNELQCRVYANCKHFISVQGGNSVLCSYFGGKNIIFAKKGLELFFNEYSTIFPKLSNAEIEQVSTYQALIDTARMYISNETYV